MCEVWKPVVGYENKYMVSNLGNVLSLNYNWTKKPKILTPVKHYSGYVFVHLGRKKIMTVHILVAEAFLPNPDKKKYVNHIDGIKHHNTVDNLEWVTAKENSQHAIKTGLRDPHKNNHPKGADAPNSRMVDQYSLDGEFIKRWDCVSDAARFIGCFPAAIFNNALGRTNKTHGYVWKFPSTNQE